jgi:hypothetical protein
MPTSVAYIGTGQIMGWGNKAIEIRSVETGHLDGVFMHKKAQRLKFLCERNDKVVSLHLYTSHTETNIITIHLVRRLICVSLPPLPSWGVARLNTDNFTIIVIYLCPL